VKFGEPDWQKESSPQPLLQILVNLVIVM